MQVNIGDPDAGVSSVVANLMSREEASQISELCMAKIVRFHFESEPFERLTEQIVHYIIIVKIQTSRGRLFCLIFLHESHRAGGHKAFPEHTSLRLLPRSPGNIRPSSWHLHKRTEGQIGKVLRARGKVIE